MKNIYLTGFMGTGKSTVAEALSDLTGLPCYDMDKLLTERFKMPISAVFEEKGEEYFRREEKELLKSLSEKTSIIVSCGGGVVKDDENIAIMKSSGKVFLLTASPETLFERLKDDVSRPLLKGRLSVEGIRDMISERAEMYEKAASHVIETDGLSPAEIAKRIVIDATDITML
ncbi:MAG: shikimate kinase [Lachnospiraceae bacterium]|nr:shikimate kinase [Lachnospiraceae bacterium]